MSVNNDGCGEQEELILDLPGASRPGAKFSPMVHGGCCFESVDGKAWARAVAERKTAERQAARAAEGR